MRHAYIIIIGVSCLLLSVSCGQQHKAESIVKEFMSDNMRDDISPRLRDFRKLDSTRHVSDSLVGDLRLKACKAARYRTDISYPEGPSTPMLYVIRVRYKVDTTTCSDTYYLDSQLQRVVAFRENLAP